MKDFDLKTRLFQHRCSYMIYSAAFRGLPAELKQRVYHRLREALDVSQPDSEYTYLSAAEKQTVRAILQGSLRDLPADW